MRRAERSKGARSATSGRRFRRTPARVPGERRSRLTGEERKRRQQDKELKTIILLTALTNLVTALINLINKLSE